MEYRQHVVEAVTSKVTYGAAGSALLFGLTANELAAVSGIVVAALALIINTATSWYFKSQHLKLARDTARQEVAAIIGGRDDE